jgi:alkaline phosphatase
MTIGFAGTKYATFFNEIAKQHMSFTAFDQEVLGPYKASLKTSGEKSALEDLLPVIKDSFGLDFQTLSAVQQDQLQSAFARSMGNEIVSVRPEDQYLLYGGYEPLTVKITQIINQQAGIGWTSYSHTGVPVATFAKGAAQELFGGYYDNTELFSKMMMAMGITSPAK